MVLAAGLLAFIVVSLLTKDLFVFTEARGYSLYRPPLDPLRFLLFPELDWGSGRLVGLLGFQLVGVGCGVSATCFNVVGAGLTAVSAVLIVVHTRQLTGSLVLALLAAGLWVTSPALMGVSVWQGTWFDLFAMIAFLTTSAIWWQVLGRARLGRAASAVFVAGSMLLLAIAFNVKETTYALVPMLPVIAVLRGVGTPGAVRRNLLLTAVPLVYALLFIAHALTHADAAYAAKWFQLPFLEGLAALTRNALGVDQGFMYLEPQGSTIEALRDAAGVGYLLVGGMILALLVAAAWRRLRDGRRTAAASEVDVDGSDTAERAPAETRSGLVRALAAFPVEIHLAWVSLLTVVMLAREGSPTSYYLLIPAWSVTALGLVVVRRLTAPLANGRAVATVVVGTWLVTHALVYVALVSPGSALSQLVGTSERLRDLGATMRAVIAERPAGPIAWRTIGDSDTSLLDIRDPSRSRPPGQLTWLPGQDLMPFLLLDPAWNRRVLPITEGSVEDIRAGTVGPHEERQLTVVVDEDYRLLLLLYEDEVVFDAASIGAPA